MVHSAFAEAWREMDARIETGPGRAQALSQARIALLTATCAIAGHVCFGLSSGLAGHLKLSELGFWTCWSLSQVVFFVLLPAAVSRFALGLDPLDFGCRFRDARGHGRVYAGLLALALVGNAVASQLSVFSYRYPLFHEAARDWKTLVSWELLYALQFVAIEFFFRGFMLRACERALGSVSIFVMMLPYCMLHAAKPWPEFLASILAGLVLGTLALATRSIWGGVVLHIAVAWSMDAISLIQTGRLQALIRW